MSRRNKHKPRGTASTPAPQATYDAVDSSTRRRAPRSTVRSEDVELTKPKRKRMISTSRDLLRNFELAGFALRMHLDYVSGFTVQYTTPDDTLNEELERDLRTWSRPANFDAQGRHSLQRMVRLGEACALTDGDFFYIMLADGTVQGIEGDRVTTPSGGRDFKADDFEQLVHGIELDRRGRMRRVCICRRENTQLLFDSWAQARNVVQRGYFTRIDQVRGITPFSSAINRYIDLYESYELALIKAKFASMLGLKVTSEKLDKYPGFDTVDAETGKEATSTTNKYKIDFSQKAPFYLEMNRGDDIDFLENKIPSTEFAAFCEQMIRMALLSVDIPYEFFDGSGVTYSLIRHKTMQYYQSSRAKRLDNADAINRILDWRHARRIATGDLRLPRGMTIHDISREIIFTGLPWLDPLKEVKANREAVAADFTSELRVCREHGVELQDILREKKLANDLRARYGLPTVAAQADEKGDEMASKTTEEI